MGNILVIGGVGGVGSAVIAQLLARGDRIVTTVLNAKEATQVGEQHGAGVQVHELDLADADAALSALRVIVTDMGTLHGLAVCAATGPCEPVEFTSLDTFRRTFEINTLAAVAAFQAAATALRATGGTIVVVSSMLGRIATPMLSAYVASKFALEAIADIIRRETGAQGPNISVVEPGAIRTGMLATQLAALHARVAALGDEERERYGALYRKLETSMVRASTGGAPPDEVAAVVVEALTAAKPKTRYVPGEQLALWIKSATAMSDEDLDVLVAGMFPDPVEGTPPD